MNGMSWLQSLKGKLFFLTLFPTLILAIVSVIAMRGITTQNEDLHTLTTDRMSKIIDIGKMRLAISSLGRFTLRALVQDTEPSTRAVTLDEVREQRKALDKIVEIYKNYSLTPKGMEIFSVVPGATVKLDAVVDQMIQELAKNSVEGNIKAKQLLFTTFSEESLLIINAMAELQERTETRTTEFIAESNEHSRWAANTVGWASGLGILLTLSFGFWIARYLSQSLSGVTNQVSNSGHHVNAASAQLSMASQQLSSGATQIAAALEETVASIEELSSMVRLNSDHAREAATLSQAGRKSAEDGESEIKQLVSSMKNISESSKKIEEIIEVIDDIAFQTNILALNAAVEAARAGEQGKGFAVVAEAVRNLAQRSSGAAKEIGTLIKASVTQVDNGVHLVERSGQVFHSIVDSIKKVAELNGEISSASQEQATGIEQIGNAMNQLEQATQTNANSAEEVAASSEEMSVQSSALEYLVADLAGIVEGQRKDQRQNENRGARQSSGSGNYPLVARGPVQAQVSDLKSFRIKKGELRPMRATKVI